MTTFKPATGPDLGSSELQETERENERLREELESWKRKYEAAKKRDIAFTTLSKKFEVVQPTGAFYIFPKAPAGITASAFVTKAIENNVLIIPGNVFSERDTHFRISYAAEQLTLERGVEVLRRLARR